VSLPAFELNTSRIQVEKRKITGTDHMKDAYDFIPGKAEGKRPLRRRKQRWENNIKVYRK
jgi:hypothetical protein